LRAKAPGEAALQEPGAERERWGAGLAVAGGRLRHTVACLSDALRAHAEHRAGTLVAAHVRGAFARKRKAVMTSQIPVCSFAGAARSRSMISRYAALFRSGALSRCAPPLADSRPRSYLVSTLVGEVLGDRFELNRLAGQGAMGEIFQAVDRSTGDLVAVKVLHALASTASARFEREATVMASFRHSGIVRHVAHGSMPAGEPYLVMEWLEGEDLAARLARRRLTVVETLAFGACVGEGLGAMHARGFVHRDVKPANMFLVGGDVAQAKVIDLGLAWSGELTRLTDAGGLVGTLSYIAPEQARGDASIDARADVFSLGCVLFECLTGATVFRAEGMMGLLTKILHEEAPRLRDRCPEAPPALDALVARMLAKDPDQRPPNGQAVAATLEAIGAVATGVARSE
jgi:serine/threonine protein kinase